MNIKNFAILLVTLLFVILIASNISWGDIEVSFHSIGIVTFLTCLIIHLMVYLLRCATMAIFLRQEVPFFYLISAHLIHNFYLHIVPASAGELSLPIILNKFISKSDFLGVISNPRCKYSSYFVLVRLISHQAI